MILSTRASDRHHWHWLPGDLTLYARTFKGRMHVCNGFAAVRFYPVLTLEEPHLSQYIIINLSITEKASKNYPTFEKKDLCVGERSVTLFDLFALHNF